MDGVQPGARNRERACQSRGAGKWTGWTMVSQQWPYKPWSSTWRQFRRKNGWMVGRKLFGISNSGPGGASSPLAATGGPPGACLATTGGWPSPWCGIPCSWLDLVDSQDFQDSGAIDTPDATQGLIRIATTHRVRGLEALPQDGANCQPDREFPHENLSKIKSPQWIRPTAWDFPKIPKTSIRPMLSGMGSRILERQVYWGWSWRYPLNSCGVGRTS